jgi:hypothetical protein
MRFKVDGAKGDWNDHRQDEETSSSCRVIGVSSLNLALRAAGAQSFFVLSGRTILVIL